MKTKILSFSIFLFLMLVGYLSTFSGNVFKNHLSAEIKQNPLSNILLQAENQDNPVLKNTDALVDKNDLLSSDNDDDDLLFFRKHIVPIRYLITYLFSALLIFCSACLSDKSTPNTDFSYTTTPKYLWQKVLRI
ncbi:hypothetical protein I5M32_09655 [Pedobacter sp. SD-b]|uniref:Uncharacterized protein n=1 Tax=Pedobacter segetis TaxID=2793069 RepID=A0ABS1BJZ7_9SPHI|nr:hypothetical protein [Pedobacter segetis]MBK0383223.1 hypothetical protein [Pedobacter segetis]